MMRVADERVGEVLVQAVVVRVETPLLPLEVIDQHGPHLAGEFEVAGPQQVPQQLVDVDLLHVVRTPRVFRPGWTGM